MLSHCSCAFVGIAIRMLQDFGAMITDQDWRAVFAVNPFTIFSPRRKCFLSLQGKMKTFWSILKNKLWNLIKWITFNCDLQKSIHGRLLITFHRRSPSRPLRISGWCWRMSADSWGLPIFKSVEWSWEDLEKSSKILELSMVNNAQKGCENRKHRLMKAQISCLHGGVFYLPVNHFQLERLDHLYL